MFKSHMRVDAWTCINAFITSDSKHYRQQLLWNECHHISHFSTNSLLLNAITIDPTVLKFLKMLMNNFIFVVDWKILYFFLLFMLANLILLFANTIFLPVNSCSRMERSACVSYWLGPSDPHGTLTPSRGSKSLPFKFQLTDWRLTKMPIEHILWYIGWLCSDAMNNHTGFTKSQMSEHRSSKICAVVECPAHQCGSDLVSYCVQEWKKSNGFHRGYWRGCKCCWSSGNNVCLCQ